MSGFEVTPRALRLSAQRVRRLAGPLEGHGPRVQSMAGQAAAANPGYLTSAAANEVAAAIARAMTETAGGLTAHAGGLGNAAATYRSTEDRAKWMMNRIKRGVPEGATYA